MDDRDPEGVTQVLPGYILARQSAKRHPALAGASHSVVGAVWSTLLVRDYELF